MSEKPFLPGHVPGQPYGSIPVKGRNKTAIAAGAAGGAIGGLGGSVAGFKHQKNKSQKKDVKKNLTESAFGVEISKRPPLPNVGGAFKQVGRDVKWGYKNPDKFEGTQEYARTAGKVARKAKKKVFGKNLTESAFGVDHGEISKGFGSSMFSAGSKLTGQSGRAAGVGGAVRGGKKFKQGVHNQNRLASLQTQRQARGPAPSGSLDRKINRTLRLG